MLQTGLDRNTQSFKGQNLQYEKDNLPSCRVETSCKSPKRLFCQWIQYHIVFGGINSS